MSYRIESLKKSATVQKFMLADPILTLLNSCLALLLKLCGMDYMREQLFHC